MDGPTSSHLNFRTVNSMECRSGHRRQLDHISVTCCSPIFKDKDVDIGMSRNIASYFFYCNLTLLLTALLISFPLGSHSRNRSLEAYQREPRSRRRCFWCSHYTYKREFEFWWVFILHNSQAHVHTFAFQRMRRN